MKIRNSAHARCRPMQLAQPMLNGLLAWSWSLAWSDGRPSLIGNQRSGMNALGLWK